VNCRSILLVPLLLFVGARSARAEPTAAPPPPAPVWYGAQTLIVDAAVEGLLVTATVLNFASQDTQRGVGVPLLAGTAIYLFGAPIVHAAHGRVGMSFASVAVRVGLALGGMLIGAIGGAVASDGDPATGAEVGAGVGGAAGAVAASMLDAFVFAYEPVSPPSRTPAIRIMPRIAAGRTTSLGLAAQF
jgi:hypothetical protein